jgi:hypothetical protein
LWGITKSGTSIYNKIKPGDVVVMGHSAANGFMYRAIVLTTEVVDFPVPEWEEAVSFTNKFIITDLRKINPVTCAEFGNTGRQSYTQVVGALAQRILDM